MPKELPMRHRTPHFGHVFLEKVMPLPIMAICGPTF